MQVMIRSDSVDILSTLISAAIFGCMLPGNAVILAAVLRLRSVLLPVRRFFTASVFFVQFCTPACCQSYCFVHCPAAFRTDSYTVLLLFGSGHLKYPTNFSSWSIGRLHNSFLGTKKPDCESGFCVFWLVLGCGEVMARLWSGYECVILYPILSIFIILRDILALRFRIG